MNIKMLAIKASGAADGVFHRFISWSQSLHTASESIPTRYINPACSSSFQLSTMSGYNLIWAFIGLAVLSALGYVVVPKGTNQT